MGKCGRCGYSRLGLKYSKCLTCASDLCEHCQMVFGYTQQVVYKQAQPPVYLGGIPVGGSAGGYESQPPVNGYVCSWNCFDRWALSFIASGQPPLVSGQTCTLAGVYLHPEPAARAIQMYRDRMRAQKLQLAGQLVQAEDFEAAARAYQELGMWKEAGDVRRRSRRQVVTQVQVNVNELVDQIRRAGISTDYTCPACKGHIKISGETSLAKLTSCEYCGSAIQTTDLVEFLTNVVGYR